MDCPVCKRILCKNKWSLSQWGQYSPYVKVNGWQRNSCKDCSDSKGEYFCSNAQKCTSKTVCNVLQGQYAAEAAATITATAPNISFAAESEENRWTKNDPTLLVRLHAALEPMLPSRAGGQANREHRAPEQVQAVWDYNYERPRLEGNPGTTPECCPEPPSTRVFPPVYTTEHPERHLWRKSLVMRLKEMAHAWDDLATTADTDNLETQRPALLKVFFVAPGADDLIKEVAAFVHPCIRRQTVGEQCQRHVSGFGI